ncbi:MAG: hypothetical protein C0392_02890 [Syntrophus sp. (in: bacteria)]|nr:hypothetical protein [Syntrophus sp. (in: bacteria)]
MRKTEKRISLFIISVVVMVTILCSCGYQLVQDKGIFGGDITSLYLPIFKNITYEPHASLYMSDAFARELTSSGLFTMNKENSDGYIEGTIRMIRILPATMDKYGVVVEKQVSVEIVLALYKRNGAFVKRWHFSDTEVYRADDINAEDYNKRNALRIVSGRMARKFAAVILIDY